MGKLDVLEGDEGNQETLKTLRRLIALNESLKSQEERFKASCKSEMARLQASIAALQGQGVEIIDGLGSGAQVCWSTCHHPKFLHGG
jgi:hypothetical protein